MVELPSSAQRVEGPIKSVVGCEGLRTQCCSGHAVLNTTWATIREPLSYTLQHSIVIRAMANAGHKTIWCWK